MAHKWDVFLSHRGPDAKKEFVSSLHAMLKALHIEAFFDHKMEWGAPPGEEMLSAMQTARYGIVVLTPRFFQSKYCMEELEIFLERKNLLPVSLSLPIDECDAGRIVEKMGPIWEQHGGALWEKCDMPQAKWRGLVDRISKEAVVLKLEDFNGFWGTLMLRMGEDLARKLGRPVECQVALTQMSLPYVRNEEFLGRDGELAAIEKAFSDGRTRVSVTAMGGMGKTQLALEYVYRHQGEPLFWVDASGGNLLSSYLGLAPYLGVTLETREGLDDTDAVQPALARRGGVASEDRQVALVREALERLPVPCLLIFDDVTPATQLPGLLPRTGECRVVVTTRLNLVSNFLNIRLDPLEQVDALTLIRGSRAPGDANFEKDLLTLCEKFEYLTLALSVCSAWLRESRLQPVDVLTRLEDKELAQAFGGREADPIFRTKPDLIALFQASIEQIKRTPGGDFGERIVWVGGWFAGVPIREEVLLWAASDLDRGEGLKAPLNIERVRPSGSRGGKEAVDLLVEFNLADRSSPSGFQQEGQVGGVVFHSIMRSFGRVKGGPKSAVAMVRSLVRKGDAALDAEHFQHACDLPIPPKKKPRIQLDASHTESAFKRIILPLVSHYQEKGLYFKARDAILGADIDQLPEVLQGLYLYAWATSLQNCGQYEEALPLFHRSLRISEKAWGPEHLNVAATLNNMAIVLKSQGKHEEALPLHERALCIREEALGPEHPDVAATLNNMAVLLESQGKYEEALPLYERALCIKVKALGPEHPSVAATLNNTGVVLGSQGH